MLARGGSSESSELLPELKLELLLELELELLLELSESEGSLSSSKSNDARKPAPATDAILHGTTDATHNRGSTRGPAAHA